MDWHQTYLLTEILWLISIFWIFVTVLFWISFFLDFSFFLRVKFVNPTNAPRASVRCVHVLGKCVDHIITLYQIHLREGPISLLLSHHLFINNLTSNIFCASCIFLLVIVKLNFRFCYHYKTNTLFYSYLWRYIFFTQL